MRAYCLAVALLATSPAAAQLAVEIVEAPPVVYPYEPVYVVVGVTNEGEEAVVIPADSVPWEGISLDVGRIGTKLENHHSFSDATNSRVMWLGPGERRLFWRGVVPGPEGEYAVEAVFRSPGSCHGKPFGVMADAIRPARAIEFGSSAYDCWEGEVRSAQHSVRVENPTTPVDLEAASFLGPLSRVRLVLSFNKLLTDYQDSHYLVAAYHAMGGRGMGLITPVLLQPENPLNPWLVGAVLRGQLYFRYGCQGGATVEGAQQYDATRIGQVAAAHPPPEGVKKLLEQLEADLQVRECPEPSSSVEEADE